MMSIARLLSVASGVALSFIPVASAAQQASTATAPGPASDETVLSAAVNEIKASNPQKAIVLLDPVIARIEQENATEKRRIYCGMNQVETVGYMMEAAAGKRDAVAIAPTLCDALFLKAFALVDLDRTDAAQTIFQRLTVLAPLHSQFQSELGNTYRLQKNWAAGLAAYQSAEGSAALSDKADVTNRRCVALRGQGFILVEQHKWDEAEQAYRKCLKAIPDEPKSLGELEYIKRNRGK